MKRGKRIYLNITYVLVGLISLYLAMTQAIIHYQIYKTRPALHFFTGTPMLEVDGNLLFIRFKIAVKTAKFSFTENIESVERNYKYRITTEDGTITESPLFTAENTDDKTIKITVVDGQTLEDRSLRIMLRSKSDGVTQTRHFIDNVIIDGYETSLYTFLEKKIVQKNTNLAMHIPLKFANISQWIAQNFGNKVVEVIKFVLMVLFGTQLILYLIAFIWQPDEISHYFNSPDPKEDVSIVDSIARKYAIPLGFMGTVFSIWTALEIKQEQFSDFNSVMEIFKGGIFTTVLGLSTNIVCLLRSNRIRFLKSFEDQKHEE